MRASPEELRMGAGVRRCRKLFEIGVQPPLIRSSECVRISKCYEQTQHVIENKEFSLRYPSKLLNASALTTVFQHVDDEYGFQAV